MSGSDRMNFGAFWGNAEGDVVLSEALEVKGNDITITSGKLNINTAASQIVPGATSFAIRNNANSANNVLVSDAGAVTVRAGLTITASGLTVTAGGIAVTAGAITTADPLSGVGYATGAGGTVTQLTSKSTGVTLSKPCGTIVMNGAALAADTTVAFTLTNTVIAANDVVVVVHDLTGTIGAYSFGVTPAAGSALISVHNNTPGSLSEAIQLRFVVIKAAVA